MIPEHTVYRGPFRGGAAVFFAQEPSKAEIINDTGGEIISFYEVPQRDFPALKREIEISPRSRKQRRQAWVISGNPDMFDRVKRAWAVRMPANASYACRLAGAFGYDRTGTNSTKMADKRADFKTNYAIRLQRTQIECRDAPNQSLADCTVKNGWHTAEIRMASAITCGWGRTLRGKAEVLTADCPVKAPEKDQRKQQRKGPGYAPIRISRAFIRPCGCKAVSSGAILERLVFSVIPHSVLWRVHRTPEKRQELAGQMKELMERLTEAVERGERNGALDKSDMRTLIALIRRQTLFVMFEGGADVLDSAAHSNSLLLRGHRPLAPAGGPSNRRFTAPRSPHSPGVLLAMGAEPSQPGVEPPPSALFANNAPA